MEILAETVGPVAAAQWTQLWDPSFGPVAVQPMRRSAHAVATFEDNLYVFGGISTDAAAADDMEHNDTWVFDLIGHHWSEVSVGEDRPSNRFHHAGALHSNATVNEFIVFGGLSLYAAAENDKTVSTNVPVMQYNDVWRLSLTASSPKWVMDPRPSSLSSVPDARSEAGIVIHNNYMFMFGGIAYDEKGVKSPVDYDDLWRYDLSTYTWDKMTSTENMKPPPRFSHSIAMLHGNNEDYLLVFSGRHLLFSSWALLDDVWAYDLTNNVWINITPSTGAPRAYTSIVITQGNKMWCFGGYYKGQQSSSGYIYDDVFLGEFELNNMVMDTRQAVIERNDASPPLRYNHQAALWRKDSMVIYGGSYQSQLGDVWVYNTTNAVTTNAAMNDIPLDLESLLYILGAFIITLVFVLLLLLVRWRRADRINLRAAHIRGAAVVHGVTKERLEQLRITKYNRAERNQEMPMAQLGATSGGLPENDDVCPICLIEFEDGEDVRNLPCRHIFHVACIDEWLKRNTSCPMCKSNVDSEVDDVSLGNSPTAARGGAVVTPVSMGP